ncbi:MAG: hypothetical protein Q4G39_08955, partial [Brachymonas sp.]|nr:hypothetical protein [Brachymonas sp.]
MKNIERYKLAMLPIPEHTENALRKEAESGDFPGIMYASQVFAEWDKYSDRVIYPRKTPGFAGGLPRFD